MIVFNIPKLLKIWAKIESLYFKEPQLNCIVPNSSSKEFRILFDGNDSPQKLIHSLLHHQIPQITVLRKSQTSDEWFVAAESRPAIPDPYIFVRSFHVSTHKISLLLKRSENIASGAKYVPNITDTPPHISIFLITKFVISGVFHKIYSLLKSRCYRYDHWQMGISNKQLSKIDILHPAQNVLQADPFLWQTHDNLIHIFFESMPYATNKGVINYTSYAPMTGECGPQKTVLERPYHLSFPFLFKYENNIFMIPETGQNRTIEIYKSSHFPDQWELFHTAMDNVIANDTVLYHDGKMWWLFTSIGEDGQKNWDELSLFYSDSPFGTWAPHPQNPIKSDCTSARMAGNIFTDNQGRLIRPAQDCTHGYGVAVHFCQIKVLTPQNYQEEIIDTIVPPNGYTGLHTWNQIGNTTIIDMKKVQKI